MLNWYLSLAVVIFAILSITWKHRNFLNAFGKFTAVILTIFGLFYILHPHAHGMTVYLSLSSAVSIFLSMVWDSESITDASIKVYFFALSGMGIYQLLHLLLI